MRISTRFCTTRPLVGVIALLAALGALGLAEVDRTDRGDRKPRPRPRRTVQTDLAGKGVSAPAIAMKVGTPVADALREGPMTTLGGRVRGRLRRARRLPLASLYSEPSSGSSRDRR